MQFIAQIHDFFYHSSYIYTYIIDRNAQYLCEDHVMKQDI